MKPGDKVRIIDTKLNSATPGQCCAYETGDEGVVTSRIGIGLWAGDFGKPLPGYVWAQECELVVENPALVKRGIRIQAQETKTGDIEILGFTGLSRSRLPDEYLNGFPRVIYGDAQLHIQVSRNCARQVLVGQVYSKQRFEEILTTCRAAGSRLREINERRPEPFEVVI